MNNLSDIREIKQLLSRHGFVFSKALGQNFLIDDSVCPKMAELSGIDSNSCVLEIGTGIGVLTAQLAKRAKKVVSLELDKRLFPLLKETLKDFDNITLLNEDILKIDLEKLLLDNFQQEELFVCANLPYYITSPVIMLLLESRLPFTSMTFMVQKEAAERLAAPVGSRQGGAITVAVNYYAKTTSLFPVSKASFLPSPKVDSEVIKMDIRKEPPVSLLDEKLFFRMIKSIFAQRRKTALNGISAGLAMSRESVALAIKNASLNEQVRGEALNMEELAILANELYKLIKGKG